MKPMACEAPLGPTRSNAMGPMRQTKIPSQMPMTRQITMRLAKLLAKGMHIVVMPRTANAICCMWMRFTDLISATFPNIIRATPDVILKHMTSRLPSARGKLSFVYCTSNKAVCVSMLQPRQSTISLCEICMSDTII